MTYDNFGELEKHCDWCLFSRHLYISQKSIEATQTKDLNLSRIYFKELTIEIMFNQLQACCDGLNSLTSNIPFQLSPVAILNKVSIALPKCLKCACGPSPWQGCEGEHSAKTMNSSFEEKNGPLVVYY